MYKISDFYSLQEKIDFEVEKDFEFSSLALLTEASNNSLCYLEDIKAIKFLYDNIDNITGIICPKDIADIIKDKVNVVVTTRVKELFLLIHNSLEDNENFDTIIEEGCIISPKAFIAPKNVIIKSGTKVEEFVSIKEGTQIGSNCFIGAGTVIGSVGFNAFKLDDEYCMVKSRGKVVIGDNTKILSNTVIEKSIYPDSVTTIGYNCVIANGVTISHDSKIGDKVLITSGVVICGFSKIGNNAYLGVNSSVRQLNTIGDSTKIGMGACINFDTEDSEVLVGSMALPLEKAKVLKRYNNGLIKNLMQNKE